MSTTLGERKKAGGGGGERMERQRDGGLFEEINNRNIRGMKRGK